VKQKKNHAQRNQTLSKKLKEEELYYDWVVTTAFYSAIHYVEAKILPTTVEGLHCKNISDVKRAYNERGRHSSRERLVFQKLYTIAIQYKWLDDKSRYARYTTYKVSKTEAEKAIDYLDRIQQACKD
jgi:uncharacterized protein (UPF0332 family)